MSRPDFRTAPFNLDRDALAWVEATFARLTPDDKLRQLFNLRVGAELPPEAVEVFRRFRPGSITRVPTADVGFERALVQSFNDSAPVPLLVSADLEGSRMSLPGGAELPNPLGLAALDDLEATTEVARIMALEARATGINWTFTPVLDINAAFRSAIVATRGFGSDVTVIERHMLATLRAFEANGVAATAKHWPGEGYDDRDQHLVTTVNPLSLDEWDRTFGRLYRSAIAAGVKSIMSGHIAFPAFARQADAAGDPYRPASISHALNVTLLREQVGFNGLVVSDATGMAGVSGYSKRSQHVVEFISSGCDIILFATDPERDLEYLHAALADGRLSWERVEEAVLRQLALKASVGLHKPQPMPDRPGTGDYAATLARRIPTLVKDRDGLLPLSPERTRRVLIITPGIIQPFVPHPLPFALPELLTEAGFAVTLFTPDIDVTPEALDLVLYLFGEETLLGRSRIFIDWTTLHGGSGPSMTRYWNDIPTVMISFGYPYYLYDAPRVSTYINAYSTTETTQRAVLDLLLGNHEWNRNNPVDPFVDDAARY